MDLNTLFHALATACNPAADQRVAAEEALKGAAYTPGHIVMLLQVSISPADQCDIAIRQGASIRFKQLLKKDWEPKSGEPEKFRPEDKQMVRDNLLESIIQAPPLIRAQLGECLNTVIGADFPASWPALVPQILQNLQTQEQPRLYGALYAMRILSSKYEFRDEEGRAPMQDVVSATFPMVLQIFQGLLQVPNPPIEVADLLKLICKTFWSCNYLDTPHLLLDPAVFMSWMGCFDNLLSLPVPTEGQPTDPDARKGWAWWKLKKWVLNVINRQFSRFGNAKQSPSKGDKENPMAVARVDLGTMFRKQCSNKFLCSYLTLLDCVRQGVYLPNRVITLALQYVTTAVTKPGPYKIIKPQIEVVMFEIVFPLLCFNEEDAELWKDDPHEYIRKHYDIIEDMYSPRTAAMNLITEIISYRGKENLPKFIGFLVNVFNQYEAAPAEAKPYHLKDGAMLAIGSLCDKLMATAGYKENLEPMLIQHVLPEYASPVGHLRAKAAWVSGQYACIQYSDKATFVQIMHRIVHGLNDPELPVRVNSVVALRTFVDASDDLSEIRPILPQLLEQLFKLMNEVENEDLVFTLETIVQNFGEEISPYAIGLVTHLVQAFWKCLGGDDDDDGDDASALAAVGCLRAICTIMESVSTLPQLYPKMEELCLPMMHKMLASNEQDVYEEVLEMASYLTYYSPAISPNLWTLFPIMCDAMQEWALDYFENILVPMDNYISRSTEVFLTCQEPHYLNMTYKLLQTTLSTSDQAVGEDDAVPAPKLMATILQHCKGRVNEWLEPYILLCVQKMQQLDPENNLSESANRSDRLRSSKKVYLKCLLMVVMANCLFYDAALTLQILDKHQLTQWLFTSWLQMLYKGNAKGKRKLFSAGEEKKMCVLGLAAMLQQPAAALPPAVQSGLPDIFKGVMTLLVDYKEHLEADELEFEDDDDDEGGEGGEDEDEDGEEEEEEEEEEDGASLVKNIHARNVQFGSDDDSDDDDWAFEEEQVSSVLDAVDPFVYFSDTLQGLQVADPARVAGLTAGLDFQHESILHTLMQEADKKRQEAAQKAQEEAQAQAQAQAAALAQAQAAGTPPPPGS